ncbi:MAG: hypothetical protein WD468_11295 [Pirellulales bacterium]
MNRFTRLIAGRNLCVAVAGVALVATVVSSAFAQRVQFPTSAIPAQTTLPATPSPYSVPAPPAFSAPVGPPPAVVSPYAVTPAAPAVPYSAPAVGAPPAFDPYAVGNSVAAPPPPAMPYNFSPPPVAPPPAQPNSLYPNGMPFQYQQPAPYGAPTTPGEGYWEKTQRFLQELSIEGTYLYGKHTDPEELSWTRFEASSTFAFPLWYNIETPLLVTPGFAFNWLGGPATGPPMGMVPGGPDLPPQVYDAYLDFAWYPRVTEYLGAELGFRTGVWSDFSYWDTDSIRFLGRGLANVSLTPQLDILFGAVYLDRLDVKILPAGGVYYRPSPEWDLYLVFPNPKIRNFISAVGNTKWYWYAAGEYGGGTWTVTRQVNRDQFDYNDIRVSGGVEFETQTQIRGHLEIGYVFDRELLFRSGEPGNFSLDNTFMFRGGVDF